MPSQRGASQTSPANESYSYEECSQEHYSFADMFDSGYSGVGGESFQTNIVLEKKHSSAPIVPPPNAFADDALADLSLDSGGTDSSSEEPLSDRFWGKDEETVIPLNADNEDDGNSRGSAGSASTTASWETTVLSVHSEDIPPVPSQYSETSSRSDLNTTFDHEESFIAENIGGSHLDAGTRATRTRQVPDRSNPYSQSQSRDLICPPKRSRVPSSSYSNSSDRSVERKRPNFIGSSSLHSSFFNVPVAPQIVYAPTSMWTPPVIDGIMFDLGSRILCIGEFAPSVYENLVKRELLRPIAPSFMQNQGVSTDDRRRIVLKLVQVSVEAKLDLEIMHLAVYLLDLSLGRLLVDSVQGLSSMAAICLILATKMEGFEALRFSQVARYGRYQLCDDVSSRLASFEWPILMTLNFRLELATPFTYANYLLVLTGSDEKQIKLAHFFTKLCLFWEAFRDIKGPLTAHACVVIAHILQRTQQTMSVDCSVVLHGVEALLHSKTGILPRANRPTMLDVLRLFLLAQNPQCPLAHLPVVPEEFRVPKWLKQCWSALSG